MDRAPTDAALARIAAALARIERAAAARPQGDDGLGDRYDRLRAAANDTLRELDALIEGRPQPD